MKSTDVGGRPRGRSWQGRWMWIMGGLTVLAVCGALRCLSGPESAHAEAPVTPTTTRAAAKTAKTAPATRTDKPQTVLASVNGEQITRQAITHECLNRFGSEVLESVINKHLIWQACQQKGIRITDEDVEAEIGRVAEKFGLSAGRWLAMLQQEREIAPEQYRREIIWPSLALRALAAQELVVTPEEMQKAFEAEYGPRVKARVITVSSQELAEQLRARAAANPGEFGALAKDYSEDQSASVHGLIPPIRKHMGDENIERIAFSLRDGEVSPVIPVFNQYVILQCEQQLPETYIAPRFRQDAENRLRDRVQDQKLRTAATDLFQRLQQEAQLVNVYNDPKLREQMPGVAATINNQRISMQQLADECLLRHGRDVLDGEINRKILMQALKKRNQQVTEQDLDAEIARAADAYGYLQPDGAPDVDAWLDEVTQQEGATIELYVRDAVWPTVALKKLVDNRVEVAPEDVQRGFVSNYGPRVEVLAIVLNNQRQAQKVWEMARDNPAEDFFGELAHQYSVDAVSRENFGRVPPIRQYGGRPELEKEAFALQPGQLSGIIVSEDTYVILRCTGYTTPVVGQMDEEVREELTKDIREKKLRVAMAVEFDRLRQSAAIENYLTGAFQSPGSEPLTGGIPARAAASATPVGGRRR
jgi:parvulin-like peptidyl-prolyl isomerase